ncbi:MAG: DUF1566 domain-containing protein [Verrucomicrobiota bacterium]|jgi:hypothetical protein
MKRLLLIFVLLAGGLLMAQLRAAPAYPIVGTGQTKCYDDTREIAPPQPGQPFYGQDAQHPGLTPSYKLSADGLTVQDTITGLTWQRSPDTTSDGAPNSSAKLTLQQAWALPAKLDAANFGGFNDWRLPTIKELYSLILFSGVDVDPGGPGAGSSRLTPFINTRYFKFAYGDANAGERTIDSQWATSTLYAANPNQMFGVNFADGRIKGYGASMPGGREKTFFAICVRSNPNYGKNDFHDNGDGTITDRATGLIWSKPDSGKGMNWVSALAWVQAKNAENYLGHNDWRLPNAKELQSIVDYNRAPAVTQSAAISPLFQVTKLGDGEYPFFWTSTTHVGGPPDRQGGAAVYIAFGRATGWMQPHGGGRPPGGRRPEGPGMGGPGMDEPGEGPPPGFGPPPSGGSGTYQLTDVHGAGAQRSDPKAGDPRNFPHGRGPQGDVIRIYNYVRLVRGGLN